MLQHKTEFKPQKKGLRALFFVMLTLGAAQAEEKEKRGGNLEQAYGIISINEMNLVKGVPTPNFKDSDINRKSGNFIEVIDLKALKTFQDQACLKSRTTPDPKTGKPTPKNCPKFEYSIPYLFDPTKPTQSATQVAEGIGKSLLDEWQTFQERAHWKVVANVNNRFDPPAVPPARAYEFYPTYCGVLSALGDLNKSIDQGINGIHDIDNPLPDSEKIYDKDINSVYKKAGIPDKYNFDQHENPLTTKWNPISLWPVGIPMTSSSKSCSGLSQNISLDSLFVYIPMARYCMGVCLQLPGWPGPLTWTNWGEVQNRALQACRIAAKTDYMEYLQNSAKTILTKMPLGLAWDNSPPGVAIGSRSGVYFAPVSQGWDRWNLQQVQDMANDAGDLGAYPYFFRPNETPVVSLDLERQKKGTAGAWRFEELKRWVKGGNLFEQQYFGFTNLFQVYQQTDLVFEQRPIFYWFHTVSCSGALWWYRCWIEAHPRPIPNLFMYPGGCELAPGEGGFITYAMPRFHYRFTSVPEGFQIPWIQGKPTSIAEVFK